MLTFCLEWHAGIQEVGHQRIHVATFDRVVRAAHLGVSLLEQRYDFLQHLCLGWMGSRKGQFRMVLFEDLKESEDRN